MKQLNFNHLYYFYVVAQEGSITKAAEQLHLTPQTISGQLATFEQHIGAPLFTRHGKRLEPNQLGQVAFKYAQDIFTLGNELSRTLSSQRSDQLIDFKVGVVDAIPKVLAYEMLNNSFDMQSKFILECSEGDLTTLLADLSINKLDLIISDQPLPVGLSIRAINHHLGESGISFFASKDISATYKSDFPTSLNQAPFLMPSKKSAQHKNLLSWFSQSQISPNVVAEFDDSALLKFFGQAGRGIFCLSSCIEHDVLAQFDVEVIGRSTEVIDRYYAIQPEQKIPHPALETIFIAANQLFGGHVDHN